MVVGGEENDRRVSRVRLSPQLEEQLDPVDIWHLDIKHDEARAMLADTPKSFTTLGATDHFKAFILKSIKNDIHDRRFVIHNHNGGIRRFEHVQPSHDQRYDLAA